MQTVCGGFGKAVTPSVQLEPRCLEIRALSSVLESPLKIIMWKHVHERVVGNQVVPLGIHSENNFRNHSSHKYCIFGISLLAFSIAKCIGMKAAFLKN